MSEEMTSWEPCGLGPCAANEGHEGSCAAASGWPERVRVESSRWGIRKRGYRTWKVIGDGRVFVYDTFPRAIRAAEQLWRARPISTNGLIAVQAHRPIAPASGGVS